jgi:MIP family channel proteins
MTRLWPLAAKAAAEFVGTYFMVFLGCGAIMVSDRFPGTIPPGAVPAVFGLSVAAMIYSVGHISGAHFNPAVTLAFVIGRHFPLRQTPAYWLAQFLGAIAAMATLASLLPEGGSYGATVAHVPTGSCIAWEALLSFFLMFVIVSVATDTRAVGVMAGTAIGSAVTLGAIVGGPITGASMNPARSLAPALFDGTVASVWTFVVGPCLGAVAAALVYNVIRCESAPKGVEADKGAAGCC